ncbi:MAG: hypothetical protein LBE01_01765 [Deltaproteobacteria bacterium]|nr:hypothetical protein [Deltaproteobacteria bacterium]
MEAVDVASQADGQAQGPAKALFEAFLFADSKNSDDLSTPDRGQGPGEARLLLTVADPDAQVDSNKASLADNPYWGALAALKRTGLTRGILTNGWSWLLLDSAFVLKDKRYLAFFLDQILTKRDLVGFGLFFRLFGAASYGLGLGSEPTINIDAPGEGPARGERKRGPRVAQAPETPKIEVLAQKAEDRRRAIEAELKNLIYGLGGQAPLLETIGQALFLAKKRKEAVGESTAAASAKALGPGPAKALGPGPARALGPGPAKALGRGPAKALGRGSAKALDRGSAEALDRGSAEALDRGPAEAVDEDAASLREAFEGGLYFIFRLVYVAFFESRFGQSLARLPGYEAISLKAIHKGLTQKPKSYAGWTALAKLFAFYGAGDPKRHVPPLAGGLFDPAKSPLLSMESLFNDQTLHKVFEGLLACQIERERRPRDFSFLSPAHLGGVYEGILDYEFRLADQNLDNVALSSPDQADEGFSPPDEIAQNGPSGQPVLRSRKKGELRLVNARDGRKASGGYYTPESLAIPLARRGLAALVAGPFKSRSLLEAKILDPACGGGQILLIVLNLLAVEALGRLSQDEPLRRRLGQELSAIEKSREKIGLFDQGGFDEFAALKRLLLKNVIFGVDLAPFAVELTRATLALDAFVFGAAPAFVEPHVKTGDSLLGTDLSAPAKGQAKKTSQRLSDGSLRPGPDENFSPKPAAASPSLAAELASETAALSRLSDASAESHLRIKEKYFTCVVPKTNQVNYYVDFKNYLDYLMAKKVAQPPSLVGALAAAFLGQPRRSDLLALASLAQEVERLKEEFRFFNWPVEFPEAFSAAPGGEPGFSLIVGNPPWDKTKFEDPLFFAQRRANYRTATNSEKKSIAEELLNQPDVKVRYAKTKEKIALYNELLMAKYPLSQGAGDNNLFRFFVEKALSLLAPGGILSYVLPLALFADDGSAELRKAIFSQFRLTRLDGFENKEWIFPDVHSRYKFCLAQLEKAVDPDQAALVRFMLTDPKDLETPKGYFLYPLADVKATSPRRLAYLETAGGAKDLLALKKLYAAFPPLDPKWLDFRRELDATVDKAIFKESPGPGLIPLYKGEAIWHYQAQAAPPRYWLDQAEFDERLSRVGLTRLKTDLKDRLETDPVLKKAFPGPFNWSKVLDFLGATKESDLKSRLVPERSFPRLAFRAIASDTNERTLISAIIPRDVGAQNSLWLSIPGRYSLCLKTREVVYEKVDLPKLLFAQAIFNSLVVDWILRASVAMNVNKTYVSRLPLPQPAPSELADDPALFDLILDSAALSLYFAPKELADLNAVPGLNDLAPPDSPEAYDLRLAQVDLKVARLYGLDLAEMELILDGFKVLKDKKPHYLSLVRDLSREAL